MLANKQKATNIELANPDALADQVNKLEQEKRHIQDKNDQLVSKVKNQR